VGTLTREKPTTTTTNPTEVVVRVDGGGRRRPSLVEVIALAGIVFVLVIGLGVARGWLGLGDLFSTRTTDRSAPVVVHRLRNLSSYRASTGTFSVTVDMEKDVSILPQFLVGSRAIYSGIGTVDATVDLGRLDARQVARSADGTLLVTLPHARLGHAVLDPERSHVMSRNRGLLDRIGGIFVDSPTSERALERAAVTRIDRAARTTGLVARAERNTDAMVRHLVATVGVDRVQVRFA
jgi:hypothetical protein